MHDYSMIYPFCSDKPVAPWRQPLDGRGLHKDPNCSLVPPKSGQIYLYLDYLIFKEFRLLYIILLIVNEADSVPEYAPGSRKSLPIFQMVKL